MENGGDLKMKRRYEKTQIALIIAVSFLVPMIWAYIHSRELSESDLLAPIVNLENPDRDPRLVAKPFKDSSYSFSQVLSMESPAAILRC